MGARVRTIMAVTLMMALAAPAGATPDVTAVWIWDEPASVDVAAVAAEGFSAIYLWAPPGFSADPSFAEFVDEADGHGMTVLAVGGDPAWAADPSAWRSWAREVDKSDLFAGAVLDVEPYLHPDWTGDRASLSRTYLQGMSRAARELDSPMWVAVPFWFDEVGYRNGTLLDQVLRRADGIVVLAYRDHALGVDGILELSSEEIAEAQNRNTDVVIGVETGPVSPEKVTFHEEGRQALEAELAIVRAELAGSPSFAGVAVHHWAALQTLGP